MLAKMSSLVLQSRFGDKTLEIRVKFRVMRSELRTKLLEPF